LNPLFAMMPADPSGAGPSPFSMLLPLLGMLLIFYFLLIRPQQKRQREMQKMIGALKKGDKVITASGMIGTVAGLRDDIVVVKVADDVKVEMLKNAITAVTGHNAE
jgi:preprotein translocase subunit YajC